MSFCVYKCALTSESNRRFLPSLEKSPQIFQKTGVKLDPKLEMMNKQYPCGRWEQKHLPSMPSAINIALVTYFWCFGLSNAKL